MVFQCRQRRSAGCRIAGERAAQAAGLRCVHDFRSPCHGSDGQTSAKRFRRSDQVRLDTIMLDRKILTSAADAGLHLVRDEHDAVLLADILEDGEELLRRGDESAFAQDGFRNHSGPLSPATPRA